MLKLFATRDKSGLLRVSTDDDLIKNNGRGYWLPKYNSRTQMFAIEQDEFPEVQWEDAKPTPLLVVNPSASDDSTENVLLSGTIEVNTRNITSPYNVNKGSKTTIFIDDVSYIEENDEETYKSIIHMKNGDSIKCLESTNRVKRMINQSKP